MNDWIIQSLVGIFQLTKDRVSTLAESCRAPFLQCSLQCINKPTLISNSNSGIGVAAADRQETRQEYGSFGWLSISMALI